jgi:CSLREA domain-containing protein
VHKSKDRNSATRQQRRAEERKSRKHAVKAAAGAAVALGASVLVSDANAATITVNSLADNVTSGDALCTLREAITNANDNAATSPDCTAGEPSPIVDLIQFETGLTGVITLDPNVEGPYSGTLRISEAVTISGPGRDALTIDGDSSSRVFYVYTTATPGEVTLSGMTVANGVPLCGDSACSAAGAGILGNNVDLTLDDLRVTGNSIFGPVVPPPSASLVPPGGGPPLGGGIAKLGTGSLSISNSEVSQNAAFAGGGIAILDADGGSHTIDNVTLSENVSVVAGGGIATALVNGSTVTVRNSVITGNQSGGGFPLPGISEPVPGFSYGAGGGISSGGPRYYGYYGGGLQAKASRRLKAKANGVILPSLTIEDTTISGNTAGTGGGLYVAYLDSAAIVRTTVSGNNTTFDGGGGVFVESVGNLVVENSTVAENTALFEGGGLLIANTTFVIKETTISGNTAGPNGGASVYVNNYYAGGPSLIENSILANGETPDAAVSAVTDAELVVQYAEVNVNYSLVENPGVAPAWNDLGTNIVNQDPQLGPLQDNGGPTFTMAPAPTSPVIDAGNPAFVPPPITDQRGLTRVSGAEIDMGSVELQVIVLVPGSFQFASPTYAVTEGGNVTITVNREGGTDGAVSVNVAVTGGTATTGTDYTFTGVTLTWADGETGPKTFVIPALSDAENEGAETVTLSLQSPTGGATVGVQSATVLTIADVPVVAGVPTLGFLMKLLLILGVGGIGVVVLGRGRLLVYLLALCLAFAATPPMSAEQLAKKPRQVRKRPNMDTAAATIQEFTTTGQRVKMRIAGETFDLDRRDIRIRDVRRGAQFRRGVKLTPGTAVVFRIRRNADGSVRRMRVLVFESLEKAKVAAEKQRAVR